MRFIVCALCCGLAGCAAAEPVLTPVPVDMPVRVACAAPEVARPDFAFDRVAANADLFDKTKAALTELEQRRAYEVLLEAATAACR